MTQIERIDEKHGKNEIILTIFETDAGRFTYSLQCSVSRVIRSIYPHQIEETYHTDQTAKIAAVDTLFAWTKRSRAANEQLKAFDITASPYLRELPF